MAENQQNKTKKWSQKYKTEYSIKYPCIRKSERNSSCILYNFYVIWKKSGNYLTKYTCKMLQNKAQIAPESI